MRVMIFCRDAFARAYTQIRASDGQGEVSTIAVKLHDKTRVGEDYQVKSPLLFSKAASYYSPNSMTIPRDC